MKTTIIIRTESETKEVEYSIDFDEWKRMRMRMDLPIYKIVAEHRKALKEAEEVSDECNQRT